jgi:hypothetical protein
MICNLLEFEKKKKNKNLLLLLSFESSDSINISSNILTKFWYLI